MGPESLATRLYRAEEIPWDEIAFPVVRETLRDYFADRRRDDFPVSVEEILLKR